jgi:Bacteriophage HK97-gp10, putative tail-component
MGMATLNFSSQISDWVKETEARQNAVFRESAQRLGELIQTTTPVDIGFLRSSFQVAVNQPLPPLNQSHPNPGGAKNSIPAQPFTLNIANAKMGDYITMGFTANYAAYLEYGTDKIAPRAWVRGAAAQWQTIVTQVVSDAKATVAAR